MQDIIPILEREQPTQAGRGKARPKLDRKFGEEIRTQLGYP